jgi:hypothetical protein
VGSCGHGNELSGCIEGKTFLDSLCDYVLYKDSAPLPAVWPTQPLYQRVPEALSPGIKRS